MTVNLIMSFISEACPVPALLLAQIQNHINSLFFFSLCLSRSSSLAVRSLLCPLPHLFILHLHLSLSSTLKHTVFIFSLAGDHCSLSHTVQYGTDWNHYRVFLFPRFYLFSVSFFVCVFGRGRVCKLAEEVTLPREHSLRKVKCHLCVCFRTVREL